ncbi:MAG: polysaccharide pyruvyl transferase family protein [Paludibacteraceae bacterium]|nr:polysaccharide pyruvyl transferase family protein [Paludibacteraceae bacterium]
MKIGILTFHRAKNYGAILQCYALMCVLRSFGHEVEILDYRNGFLEGKYKIFSLNELKNRIGGIRSLARYLKKAPNRYIRSKKFDEFVSVNIPLSSSFSDAVTIPQSYDAYVIGSDQLWNDSLTGTFDDVFLGEFPHPKNSKVVGYAISSNVVAIRKMGRQKLENVVANFSKLSFREKTLSDLAREITGCQVPVVVDPTLLTDYSVWEPLVNKKYADENYVLSYQIRGNAREKAQLLKQAKELGEKLNCKVIDVDYRKHDVYDFLSLLKYAKYVVTSSFHGTAFSIIFRKQFACVKLNDKGDVRYLDLLRALNLENLAYDLGQPIIPTQLDPHILEKNLLNLRNESIEFLRQI